MKTLLSMLIGAAVLIVAAASPVLSQSVMPEMAMEETTGGGTDMSDMQAMSDSAATHQHPLRAVSLDAPVPGVTHLVFPDAMEGYNVQILAKNFRFTPAAINGDVEDNEGHAHIYVNGVKYARVYSEWFHLPSAALLAGVNLVSVTLNANDHSEWAVDGAAVSSTVRVIKPE